MFNVWWSISFLKLGTWKQGVLWDLSTANTKEDEHRNSTWSLLQGQYVQVQVQVGSTFQWNIIHLMWFIKCQTITTSHLLSFLSSPIPCSGISSDSIILTLIWTVKPYLQSHVRMATTAWAGQCMRVTNYIIVPTCHSLIKSSFQNGLQECFTCFLNVNICAAVYHLILR